ncbi:hypothetical protein HY970_01425, partial [Candidatus Kaiserbacteria bacterium]|nr:hypothetical protein [Candidatus Kaiserbacteria bacterium]
MKISRKWLQTYFDEPLPNALTLADALTFHAFEIESVDQVEEGKKDIGSPFEKGLPMSFDEILDVKVTPNRGHDCLSHRGIAKEISAILNIRMKDDGLR